MKYDINVKIEKLNNDFWEKNELTLSADVEILDEDGDVKNEIFTPLLQIEYTEERTGFTDELMYDIEDFVEHQMILFLQQEYNLDVKYNNYCISFKWI